MRFINLAAILLLIFVTLGIVLKLISSYQWQQFFSFEESVVRSDVKYFCLSLHFLKNLLIQLFIFIFSAAALAKKSGDVTDLQIGVKVNIISLHLLADNFYFFPVFRSTILDNFGSDDWAIHVKVILDWEQETVKFQ